MSLRFVLGRAGTGKTSRCLEEIDQELLSRDGPAIVFLVPEQATLQTELALLGHRPGVLRAQVLSFRRLTYRILQEAGGLGRPHIADAGKQMVLRTLTNQRKEDLRVFQRMAGQSGFGTELARVISELKHYCVTPGDLRDVGAQVDDPLRDKLNDLAIIYSEMEDYLADRYTDPDDYLALASSRLPLAASFKGALFWLDAFNGFTPAEFLVLEAIMRVAARVTVTLCQDAEDESLFLKSRNTRSTLELLARRTGHIVEEPLFWGGVPPRFAHFPACAHLEKHFFRTSVQTKPFAENPGGISLVGASTRREEVEMAVREMVRLAREDNLRYRDMLVLVRDLEPYRNLLTTVMADLRIPFFVDYKRPVAGHPLADLIRGALLCAMEDWSFAAVFRYLKTGLVNVAADQVDEVENYVLAHGTRGAHQWTAPWNRERDEDVSARVNQTRQHVIGPLAELHRTLQEESTVREMTAALYEFLIALDVPERLAAWERRASEAGRLTEAAEHGQVFAAVVELFDQVVESLGDEKMTVDEYAAVLEDGLAALRLGLIPPGLDQVLIGSLDHSRTPGVRAAFVLGANDGMLPARPPTDGFFTDVERGRLANAGLVLAPGARECLLDEEYLVYVALTRASERLYISYALTGADGAALTPSMVVQRLGELLPGLAPPDTWSITGPGDALSQLAVKLREAKTGGVLEHKWQAVYNWALTHQPQRLALITNALDYTNREKPVRLFQAPLTVSVSRLQRFRACPFAHFLTYGLRLRERKICELAAPDQGQYLHEVLQLVGEKMTRESLNWSDLAGERGAAMVKEAIEKVTPTMDILLSTARYRHFAGKLGRLVHRSVQVLAEHDSRGEFRTVALEADFGPGGDLAFPVFDPSGSIRLTGRIDRIDLAQDSAGRQYVRVIDYKSGPMDFSLNDVYQGLSLQLMVYLYVASAHQSGAVLPAGAFYFRLQDPLVAAEGPLDADDAAQQVMREFRMKGLVLGDDAVVRLMDAQLTGRSQLIPVSIKKDGTLSGSILGAGEFDALLQHVRKLVLDMGREILSGVVDISPSLNRSMDACRWCDYHAVCRFDPRLGRDSYRRIVQISTEEIVRRLKEGDSRA